VLVQTVVRAGKRTVNKNRFKIHFLVRNGADKVRYEKASIDSGKILSCYDRGLKCINFYTTLRNLPLACDSFMVFIVVVVGSSVPTFLQ